MKTTRYLLHLLHFLICALIIGSCKKAEVPVVAKKSAYRETHRPHLHFSPKEMWMNDPNGMVYYNGEYHLFYQHYPDSTVWGPMHWGHAVSKDLLHWEHLPIALYPDSLGMIFSGGAVVDKQNTSGFGTTDNPPLVAIYTYHNAAGEKAGRNDYQTQGLAYSVDNGRSWTKYDKNPVIRNPGVRDFRDPKFFWHEESKQWILVLVAGDRAEIYGSPDLKVWIKLSEFGKDYGAHGGVWECPDLFPLKVEGEEKQKWIMIININPGGPNGGSATQYFVGEFDGKKFTCDTDKSITKWLDYGPDNYAGVTWSNTPGNETLFFGWMGNWDYAQSVPTTPWRSANTLPRFLRLKKEGDLYYVRSILFDGVKSLVESKKEFADVTIQDSLDLTDQLNFPISTSLIEGTVGAKDFALTFSNSEGQNVKIGFDAKTGNYFINRKSSGKTDFSPNFIKDIVAPRIARGNSINFTMVLDVSSVEILFDDGLTVLTAIFFPEDDFGRLKINSPSGIIKVDSLVVSQLSSVW